MNEWPLPMKTIERWAKRENARTPLAWADEGDYVSIAMLGMLKAQRAFDPQRGVKLTTLAWSCIRAAVVEFRRNAFGRQGQKLEGCAELDAAYAVAADKWDLFDLALVVDDVMDGLTPKQRGALLRVAGVDAGCVTQADRNSVYQARRHFDRKGVVA